MSRAARRMARQRRAREATAARMAAKKAAMRADLERRRAAAREKLARQRARRPIDPRKSRVRRRVLLAALLLILLALLPDCSCSAPPEPVGAAPEPVGGPAAAPEAPPAPANLSGHLSRRDRPDYDLQGTDPLPWLAAFRMQVAARSPRLAECFVGASRPGSIKWTTTVDPATGRTFDHTFEPTVAGEEVPRVQKSCITWVLEEPAYRLTGAAASETPSRVSLVIEF